MKTMPEAVKEPRTKLQRALDLKKKLEDLETEAKEEALETIKSALADLQELGFKYHLLTDEEHTHLQTPAVAPKTAPGATKKRKAKEVSEADAEAAKSAKFKPAEFCNVCKKTGHNTRAHNFHKAAFTQEELEAKGWAYPPGFTEPVAQAS